MIVVKVNSLWQGKVGIRDKYVTESQTRHEDLEITYQNEILTIPWREITSKIVGKSDRPFKDRYSFEAHYLVYFDWKPTDRLPVQHTLQFKGEPYDEDDYQQDPDSHVNRGFKERESREDC